MCWVAWRTSLLQANHTRAVIQIPQEFNVLFTITDTSTLPSRSFPIVASKKFGRADATMWIHYSTRGLDAAELEWMGDTPNDHGMLDRAKTALAFPFGDVRADAIEQWPGAFSTWIDETLCEFRMESAKSHRRKMGWKRVWEDAERAARSSLATSITDQQVALQFLRLPGNEAILLEEQCVHDRQED